MTDRTSAAVDDTAQRYKQLHGIEVRVEIHYDGGYKGVNMLFPKPCTVHITGLSTPESFEEAHNELSNLEAWLRGERSKRMGKIEQELGHKLSEQTTDE